MDDAMTRVRGAIDRRARRAWRKVRRHLPDRVAEAIRVPAKRAWRKMGLQSAPPTPDRPQPSPANREAIRDELRASPAAAKAFRDAVRSDPAKREAMRDALKVEGLRSDVSLNGFAECPVCGTTAETFLPFGVKHVSPDRKCPECGSLERHRLIWMYFAERTNLFTDELTMLHVAPEPFFGRRLRAHPNLQNLSGDLCAPKVSVRMDLLDIPLASGSVDVVYASHVLEHVADDVRAMKELRRILTNDGWAVLQVPIWGDVTCEDPSVTDPDERTRLFGQADHVRMYGHDGEYERRLQAAGFNVKVDPFAAELGRERMRRYRLPPEDVYFCTKS